MHPRNLIRVRRGGFTLFEVVLAASIFVFLVGGVYLVVSSAISAGINLGEVQIQARRVSAFQDFLRNNFVNLPAPAELRLRAASYGTLGTGVELVIKNAADAFGIGGLTRQGSGVVLGTEPDGKGKSIFFVSRFPSSLAGDDALNDYLEKATKLPLLDDVESVRWLFWDQTEHRFVESWDRGRERPTLIELLFQLSGEPPQTCLFKLPEMAVQ